MDIRVIDVKLLLISVMNIVVATLEEHQVVFQKSEITNVNVKMVSLDNPAQIMKFQRIHVRKIILAIMAVFVSISHIEVKMLKNVFANRDSMVSDAITNI